MGIDGDDAVKHGVNCAADDQLHTILSDNRGLHVVLHHRTALGCVLAGTRNSDKLVQHMGSAQLWNTHCTTYNPWHPHRC